MHSSRAYIGFGILLVAAGILFLLQSFGLLAGVSDLIWIVLSAAGGLAFLWVYIGNRERWWPLIPGCALLGIAATIALSEVSGPWAGAVFLAAIGASFWIIYLARRENWWAIIPGGILVTLAFVSGLAEIVPGTAVSGVLFLGMALTFALLAFLPTPRGPNRWAIIPAIVLAVIGLALIGSALFAAAGKLLIIIGPIVLILFGGYLLLRAFARRR